MHDHAKHAPHAHAHAGHDHDHTRDAKPAQLAKALAITGAFLVVEVIGGILTGVLMGLINGVNITFLRLPPFIATLAMMMIAGGLALVISGVAPIYFSTSAPDFKKIALGVIIPGIPNAVLVAAVLAIIAYLVLSKTLLGRYTFAIGSNEEATRLSGVNTRRWTILIYMFAGAFTGVAGIVIATLGPGPAFALNAASFVVVVGALALVRARSVANTVTTRLVSGFVEAVRYIPTQPGIAVVVVMLQREVAGRICARAGDSDYSALSVIVSAGFDASPGFMVGPNHFFPRPKVESQVVRLVPKISPIPAGEMELFKAVVSCAFHQRRKVLGNSLIHLPRIDRELLEGLALRASIDIRRRPQEVSPAPVSYTHLTLPTIYSV